ncbi:CD3e molecule%2C epsilon associated protein [Scomber scombrus]|uniref:CD3e molecule, epsilon associated protein n=1 Tax=Scomber scombrus TaxID=13677 RepID=A0AAV1NEE7_SCOSC|nr:CD3e molecule, epsilon associated protein [Scomber scombrus]
MPRDISSSSSEDEADSPNTESPAKQKESNKKPTRYQCPADFVSFCHKPCSSTLTNSLKKKKKELWLIKAPASFNPECINGIKVPLSGLQTVKIPTPAAGAKRGSGQQIYSVLASTQGTSELSLLTSNKQSSDGVVFGPAFSGLLNVCETYGDSSTNQAPQVIPATPAPSIPPGLKQRFHPFGSKTPTLTCVAESETDGATFGPSSTTLRPLVAKRLIEEVDEGDEDDERKKKKKKKKEKRIKTEREEKEEEVVVSMKKEPVAEIHDEVTMEIDLHEGDVSQEKRKKKKKKKDREREEVEEGVEPAFSVKQEEVTVKSEPIDTSYGDAVDSSAKKKKKKKKSKTDDD